MITKMIRNDQIIKMIRNDQKSSEMIRNLNLELHAKPLVIIIIRTLSARPLEAVWRYEACGVSV